ncbi:uncharacterized protein [Parasteatoda tepidariorum]|uniref:uncharacterized protein n=1 Tax=Parasteatoda tepidariorum TaxID=114398 RepID=UPI000A2C0424|nr:uncharacterized protein LOC110282956 [Parasteatoda tepidariorum]
MNSQRTTQKSTANTPIYDQENKSLTVTKLSNTKRVERLLNDVRITACRTITNVKSSIGDLSMKLRPVMKTRSSFCKRQNYQGLNENITPVKLYTPFSFVTPSPKRTPRKRVSPKRISFKSPTGKLKKDVQALNKSVKEREKMERTLSARKLR